MDELLLVVAVWLEEEDDNKNDSFSFVVVSIEIPRRNEVTVEIIFEDHVIVQKEAENLKY